MKAALWFAVLKGAAMEYVIDAFAAEYIDRYTIESCGVPGILLMEHAAEAVAEKIMEKHDSGKKVLCVAGKGNNGGDAAAVCRLLREKGYDASCLVVLKNGEDQIADKESLKRLEGKVSDDLFVQLKAFTGLGGSCRIICGGNTGTKAADNTGSGEKAGTKEADRWQELFGVMPDIVVDGLFGTGLGRAPEGIYKTAVEYINLCGSAGAEIYSVDIPSGVDASTGKVPGICVHADYTVTFGYRKMGQLLYPGRGFCGQLSVHKIGFCENAVGGLKATEHVAVTLSPHELSEYMPKRFADSNKGSYGRVLIVAGSDYMPGACVLTAKTALRSGCGLVTVCSSEKVLDIVASSVPEVILMSDEKIPELSEFTACLAGPGLGRSEESIRKVENLLERGTQIAGIVYDADAVNILADKMNRLGLTGKEERLAYLEEHVPSCSVFTPHKKELSRLFRIPMEELADLTLTAKWLSANSDRVFVLKDAATLVAGKGRIYINTTGNNGMSTAGSGDVLGGIIVSLLAQGSEPFTAACTGVCLHGLAGDSVKEEYGEYGVMAGDISDRAAKILRQYSLKQENGLSAANGNPLTKRE